jgi:fumarate hydratase class II
MTSFRTHCIEGIEVDAARVQSMIEHSLIGVTALVPHIGYDRAAKIARHAHAQGLDVRQAALDVGGVGVADYDAWVDLHGMSAPDQGKVAPPPTS